MKLIVAIATLLAVATALPFMPTHPVRSEECDECIDIVSIVKEHLDDPGLKEKVLTVVEHACALLADFEPICNALAEDIVDAVLDTLAAQSAEEFCKGLHLCSVRPNPKIFGLALDATTPMSPSAVISQLVLTKTAEVMQQKLAETPNGPECDICKQVVALIQAEMAKGPEFREGCHRVAEEGCAIIPELEDKCNAAVGKYLDEALDDIAEGPPERICSDLC